MNLTQKIRDAFDTHRTDKGFSHSYERWYAKVFEKFTPNSLLEVGIYNGRSLSAWRQLFPFCKLSGADIKEIPFDSGYLNFTDCDIITGDSTNPEFINKLADSYDVIIDDGSHHYKDIMKTFYNLRNKFTKAYIIEDAMYKQDFLVWFIKRLGFNNVEVYDSMQQNIPVNSSWLKTKVHSASGKDTTVDLKFVVVYPN